MITVVFTDRRMLAYCHLASQTPKLVDAELAGRSYPMTSTFHVFLKTLIERYKDTNPDVMYPIPLNIVFPTALYFSEAARYHLLKYILDRSDVIRINHRKSLMEAAIEGWLWKLKKNSTSWIAIQVNQSSIIGIKESEKWALKIKHVSEVGKATLLDMLNYWAIENASPQSASVLSNVKELKDEQVDQLFGQENLYLEFAENQEVPDSNIRISKSFQVETLKNISNAIFLHINKLYVKLPYGNPVFLLGSFLNSPTIRETLEMEGLRYDYRIVFINEDQMPELAVASFNQTTEQQTISEEQTHLSTSANNTSTFDNEVNLESSPQYQTTTQITDSKMRDRSMEPSDATLISKEFVIEDRFKNQIFLLFKGYRKSDGIRRYYRFITYADCKSEEKQTDFIKLYKKERKLFPDISTIVNGQTGKYYYIPDIKAKPLKEVIASSRLKIGSSKSFKNEDVQLLNDIYKALIDLPITFAKLTADNIYVSQANWWKANSTNKIYFLGIDANDSTKEDMTNKLNEVLQSLINPTILDHINN